MTYYALDEDVLSMLLAVFNDTNTVSINSHTLQFYRMDKILQGKDTAVFDFDGTLSDTLTCNYQLDNQLLGRYGASLTEYDYHALGGLTFINLFKEYQRRFSLPVTAE